jgi:hypothetical protein
MHLKNNDKNNNNKYYDCFVTAAKGSYLEFTKDLQHLLKNTRSLAGTLLI